MSQAHSTTRSVIGTALSFFADVALEVNWFSLYLLEDRKFKAANTMHVILNYIGADIGHQIPLDDKDVKKFKALYWDGVSLVEYYAVRNGIDAPYQHGVAYNVYPAEKKVEVEIRGRKVSRMEPVMMAEYDGGEQELPEAGISIKDIMGFYYLTPLNPVRSKAGMFSTFRMIRMPVPIREGWAGYDVNQIIKNAQLFTSHWDPSKNMVVEEPINIDVANGQMHIVSVDWHSKMTGILWQELSKVMQRIKKKIIDTLEDEEIDEKALFEHISGGGSTQIGTTLSQPVDDQKEE